MKTNNPKILIPLIRKIYPKMIAAQIVGVQPMTEPAGEIFNIRTLLRSPWTPWKKIFSWKIKRSINGRWIFGRINVSMTFMADQDGNHSQIEYKWATNKELFTSILKGDA